MLKLAAVAVLCLGFAVVGCGGSDSGGGGSASNGSFSTSVPSSTSLGGLSDSQATTLCNELESYEKTNVLTVTCGVQGLVGAETLLATNASATDAQLQAACKSADDDCNTSSASDAGTCDKPDATCKATVGDLTTCLNDETKTLATVKVPACATLTKDNLTSALASLAGLSGADPASCTAFDKNCPDTMIDPGAM